MSATLELPCLRLRHKGMYVMSLDESDDANGSYDATAYWCTSTQKPYGPDGKPAHRDSCRGGRTCCEH